MASRPFDPEAHAIDAIRQQALRRVERLEDLPAEFRRRPDIGTAEAAGWLFAWRQPGGRTVEQFRSDHPPLDDRGKEKKYLFPKDCPGLLSIPPEFDGRVMDAALPLVVVEGSAQHLAVASALSGEEIGVVGISGCNGWSKGHAPIQALEEIPLDGRKVYLLPDADMASNAAVWKGITDLAMYLRGEFLAESVLFITLPGHGKDGADDVLGRRKPEGRKALALSWLDKATEEAPPPPPDRQLSYEELLESVLGAVEKGRKGQEMEARSQLMRRFARKDEQITAEILDFLQKRELGVLHREGPQPDTVNLDSIEALDAQVEGFTFKNKQSICYAAYGTGKTTAALGLAFAHIEGRGFLDRDCRHEPGRVLFIASDSGAAPINAQLHDLGLIDHPAITGSDRRFFLWASDAAQGMEAWACDVRGLIRLLSFVKANGITLVVIDSVKAVLSKAGISYTDNMAVTAVLTFVDEVICRHTSVHWLNHDGTERNSGAGAKSLAEIPSIVHQIVRVEGRPDIREWICRKARVPGLERSFHYHLQEGELVLAQGVEVVSDAADAIRTLLSEAWKEGHSSLSRKELQDSALLRFNKAAKTVDNTLHRLISSSERCIVRDKRRRGHYALSPKERQRLRLEEEASSESTPLNTSTLYGQEKEKNLVREREVGCSRQLPEGTRRELANYPREKAGNKEEPCEGKGSSPSPAPGTEIFVRAREPISPSPSAEVAAARPEPTPSPEEVLIDSPNEASSPDQAEVVPAEASTTPARYATYGLPSSRRTDEVKAEAEAAPKVEGSVEDQIKARIKASADRARPQDQEPQGRGIPEEPTSPKPPEATADPRLEDAVASLLRAFSGSVVADSIEGDLWSSTERLNRSDLQVMGCRALWLPEDQLSPDFLLDADEVLDEAEEAA